MALTDQKRLFAEEYLKAYCRNQTEAAIRAGYSEKTAAEQSVRLMKDPAVREYIDLRLREVKMGTDEVLMRLTEQARGEASRYLRIGEDGKPYIDVGQAIVDGKAHLIKGVSRDKFGNVVVETYDAHAALVDMGRVHKLFTDKFEFNDTDLNAAIERELARVAAAGTGTVSGEIKAT